MRKRVLKRKCLGAFRLEPIGAKKTSKLTIKVVELQTERARLA